MALISEAHLAPARRTIALVRYLPARKHSWWQWALFFGFFVLNETRGVYMVATFLRALSGH